MSHPIGVHPIAGALGAEISGVDLSTDLTDDTVTVIRRAWLEHLVIFFRDQDLSPAEFLVFARRFGEVIEYPFVKGLDEFPEIVPVVKLEHELVNFGGIWHSDTAYLEVPPMASMLVAREVPPLYRWAGETYRRIGRDRPGGEEAPETWSAASGSAAPGAMTGGGPLRPPR